MHNREGQKIELTTLSKVEEHENGFDLTQRGGWTFSVSKDECNGFVPQAGDWILTSYEGFNTIAGIIVEGHVLRAKTSKQVADEHAQWVKNYRLEKLERYVKHGEALKERVKNLHPVLQARMNRFASESGVEFWIDSAPYGMACLEGAQALLNKVAELGLIANSHDEFKAGEHQAAVDWVNDWWDINSDKHDPPYDYKKQMELVPDFGDGHSGNTAAAAKSIAVMILQGRGNEL